MIGWLKELDLNKLRNDVVILLSNRTPMKRNDGEETKKENVHVSNLYWRQFSWAHFVSDQPVDRVNWAGLYIIM